MTLTEYIVTHMPQVDIMEVIDKTELFSTKFLFYYAPLIGVIMLAFKGLQFLFRGIKLWNLTTKGKYFKGKIVDKQLGEDNFYETGRWFFLKYPVVRYKHRGEFYTCIANKPSKAKIGDTLSVYVCRDGDEHLLVPAILTLLWGIFLLGIGIIGTVYVQNVFQMFASI